MPSIRPASRQWWRHGHSHLDESEIWIRKDGSPATIELWATENQVEGWSRIFDFGSTGGGLPGTPGKQLTLEEVERKIDAFKAELEASVHSESRMRH